MNVPYSNDVINTVKYFRENIYGTDEFKETFSSNLSKTINATNTDYIPEQLGGWSVNVSTSSSGKIESSEYVNIVADVLADTIHNINKSISCRELAVNLSNVLVTGPNSISIRL